jgi:two-component system sensor histidine kinase PilS (NtrC family)
MKNSELIYKQTAADNHTWQALQLFALYRFLLSGVFILVQALELNFINVVWTDLYIKISYLYIAFSLCSLCLAMLKKPKLNIQAHFGIIIDLLAIIVVMITCQGMVSGIGILLVIMLAGYSLLAKRKHAVAASIATSIILISAQFYTIWKYPTIPAFYNHLALLVGVIFATVLITTSLAHNIRRKQQELASQGIKLAQTENLAEHIVSTMQSGILAYSMDKKIVLINKAAKKLLDIDTKSNPKYIHELPKQINDFFNATENSTTALEKNHNQLRFNFQQLKKSNNILWIVHISDMKAEAERIQQLKLASLGHLSANIAHELRNPLSAINHAAQLLQEKTSLSNESKSLVEIINRHSLRINLIIKNVLTLSRRKQVTKHTINLTSWVEKFLSQNFTNNNCISFTPAKNDLLVKFDSSQLTQILVNLCENGLRHGDSQKDPSIIIKASENEGNYIYLDIIDNGPGIQNENIEHIFDPFFSTKNTGTGLGLTIAKELCSLNQAHLDYIQAPHGGAQFRISIQKEA